MRSVALLAFLPLAAAAEAPDPNPDIVVIAPTPLGASGVARDTVPGNTTVLNRADLERSGPSSALRALDERASGVTLTDPNGSGASPNLLYRGFEASPLVGNPQGLAVYVNGQRFNAPFGDTVNWDLIPDAAITRADLTGANPAFGLNALGGALSVHLRDGFSSPGARADISGGSYGRRAISLEYGIQRNQAAAYVAASALEDDGWRVLSPTRTRALYATIGRHTDRATLDLDLGLADNHLTGVGVTPVELLATNNSAVFTNPDNSAGKYASARLRGGYDLTDTTGFTALAYYTNFVQRTANGNQSDSVPCADNPGLVCQGDGVTRVIQRGGATVPDILRGGTYGEFDRTGTDTNGFGVSAQITNTGIVGGLKNRLAAGVSYDAGRTRYSTRSDLASVDPALHVASLGIVLDEPGGPIVPVRIRADTDFGGVYITDSLSLTPALTLTAAARANIAQVALHDENGGAVNGTNRFARINPALGATYALTPWLTAYAGYAEANRAPSPAELSCANPLLPCTTSNFFVNDPPLKQVVSRTIEAGVRGASGGVTYHLGLFRADNADDILYAQSLVLSRGYFANIGNTRRQGLEAGLAYAAGPVNAFAEYDYTEATFQTALTRSTPNNPGADANGNTVIRAGDRLPGIPAHLLKFGLDYTPVPRWTLGITGTVASGRPLLGDEANLTERTTPYAILGFDTTYRVTDAIEVYGIVRNALDRRYATAGAFTATAQIPIAAAPGATNPRALSPGAPIAGYVGLRIKL